MLKGKDYLIIIVAIFIVGILILFFTSTTKESNKLYKNLLDKNTLNQSIGTSSANESQGTSSGSGAGAGGSSGAGGGSNSGGNSGDNSKNCITKEITYSMFKFNKTETCNQYDGESCINKTVYCTTEVQNRDTLGGNFEIKLSFVEMYKGLAESFDSKTRSFHLEPNEKYIFEDFTQIQSTGQDGLANKIINCYYINSIVPKKEICQ